MPKHIYITVNDIVGLGDDVEALTVVEVTPSQVEAAKSQIRRDKMRNIASKPEIIQIAAATELPTDIAINPDDFVLEVQGVAPKISEDFTSSVRTRLKGKQPLRGLRVTGKTRAGLKVQGRNVPVVISVPRDFYSS